MTYLLVHIFIPTKYESNPLKNKGNIQLWKKVNQKVNLRRRPTPGSLPGQCYFKGQIVFFKKKTSKKTKKRKYHFFSSAESTQRVVKVKLWFRSQNLWYYRKHFSRHLKYFYFFPESRLWHFMQIVSVGDNLHECQSLFSGKNRKKYQFAICWIYQESCIGDIVTSESKSVISFLFLCEKYILYGGG